MKRESIYFDGLPRPFREFEDSISRFIKIYNTVRPREHLDYCSPEEFEKALWKVPINKRQKITNNDKWG